MAIQLSLYVVVLVCLLRFMGWSIRRRARKGETELKPLKSCNPSTEGIKSLKEMRGKLELEHVCEIPVLRPLKKSRLGLPSVPCGSGWRNQKTDSRGLGKSCSLSAGSYWLYVCLWSWVLKGAIKNLKSELLHSTGWGTWCTRWYPHHGGWLESLAWPLLLCSSGLLASGTLPLACVQVALGWGKRRGHSDLSLHEHYTPWLATSLCAVQCLHAIEWTRAIGHKIIECFGLEGTLKII